MFFNPGLYENAYLDLDESTTILASDDKVAAGYAAQLDSVVLLKNDGETVTAADAEAWKDKTVYIPRSDNTGFASSFGPGEYTEGAGIDLEVAEQYFGTVLTDEAVTDADDKVTSYTAPDLSDVDLVLVGMDSPDNGGTFSNIGHDVENDTWYPLSLQYRPYTADGPNVRQTSISGDLLPDGTRENRSYFGNTSKIANESDLDAFERAVAAVEASGKDIPVVTVLKATNPVVPAEFEPASDAIVVGSARATRRSSRSCSACTSPRAACPSSSPGHGHGRGAAGGRREGHDALHRRRGQRLRLRLRTELRRADHGLTYRTGGRSYERPPARGGRRPSGAVRPRPRRGWARGTNEPGAGSEAEQGADHGDRAARRRHGAFGLTACGSGDDSAAGPSSSESQATDVDVATDLENARTAVADALAEDDSWAQIMLASDVKADGQVRPPRGAVRPLRRRLARPGHGRHQGREVHDRGRLRRDRRDVADRPGRHHHPGRE